jgi:hypothetical protein
MANISVVFPKSGKVPVVMPDLEGVLGGEPITWQIYTQNRGIKSVKLAFEKGSFFEGAPEGPKECLKNFTFNGARGYAVMLGKAPGLKRRQVSKYTIYGYSGLDGGGTLKAVLDPTIITDPPAPVIPRP